VRLDACMSVCYIPVLAHGIDYEPLMSVLKLRSREIKFDNSERDNRVEVSFPCNLLMKQDGLLML
jgi:hypothetical protein